MKKPAKKEPPMLRSYTVRLPADTIRALKIYAVHSCKSVQTIVGEAVETYLKTHAKEAK